jgi:DNA-binding response OmpR family regulator
VVRGDVLDDGQAEAGAPRRTGAGRVRAVEALEDPLGVLGADADALLDDVDLHHRASRFLDDSGTHHHPGPVRMDVDRHTVVVGGSPVALPLKEFDLLELLLRNAGRVLTRMQLIDRVWGSE